MDTPRQVILNLMRTSTYRPMNLRELIRHFDIPREERPSFTAALDELTETGEILLIKGKKYGLPRKMNLVVGKLHVHPDGFGFVKPEEGGDDVYVKGRELNTALHGDKVVVRVEHARRGERTEGRVIRVLERANTRVVGRFERFPTYGYLTPSDPHLPTDIYVSLPEMSTAQTGDMAVVEITSYASRNRTPEGRVTAVLGRGEDPGVDEAVVINEHGLAHVFSGETRREAAAVPREVLASETARRTDLRKLLTVTIDGETAKDFDDAVSLERTAAGTWKLWVHIADVSHYVRTGSALDREALERGTSVYFPGMVIPMLPEELSNNICSLNPAVDRLAFSAVMEFDRLGHMLRSDFMETVICSNARMTYTQVAGILERDELLPPTLPAKALEVFRWMAELAAAIRVLRMKKGSIDFDLPEAEIILDLRGRIESVLRSERTVAHRIIEEFMLAANRAVASHVARLEQPFVYRVHEEPNVEKLDLFRRFVASFGFLLPDGKVKPLDLSDLVRQVEGRPEAPCVNNLLLRSMKQARYDTENVGHFGLAFEFYTHFTSPIRRYPDLIVHRLLKEILAHGRYTPAREAELEATLPVLTRHCSDRERTAMEAEREIVQLKKIRFMQERVGEEYDGFIVGVTSFGFFVELTEFMVDGLVHVSSLGDDYYNFDEEAQTLSGRHTKRSFRVGDAVRVRVDKVSVERRQVDFALLAVKGQPELVSPKPRTRPPGEGARSGQPGPKAKTVTGREPGRGSKPGQKPAKPGRAAGSKEGKGGSTRGAAKPQRGRKRGKR